MTGLPILSYKQNKFVKLYILYQMNASEAYRTAYDSKANTATCSVEASRLLKNPKITPWIDYYREKIQESIDEDIKYSLKEAFNEFDELKCIALESRDQYNRPNVAAANKAVEMKCKLKGYFKDDVKASASVVMQMDNVEIDGIPLQLNIGEDPDVSEEEQ